jgi:hypothetical protein
LQVVFVAVFAWVFKYYVCLWCFVLPNQGAPSVDGACSGRAKVGWIGAREDNYIEFQHIYASVEGDYQLSLTYSSGEDRNATMIVNGQDTLLTKLNSGSFSKLKTSTYPVHLQKGYNTIRFTNAATWMPDMDKIRIDLNKYGTITVTKHTTSQPIRILPNPCSDYVQVESEQPVKRIDLYSMSGKLMKTYQEARITVSDLNAGSYILKVTTTGKEVYTQKIIKV